MGKKTGKKGKRDKQDQQTVSQEVTAADEHHLLQEPDTLKLGETMTIEDLWKNHMLVAMQNDGRRNSTIKGVARAVRHWETWLQSEGLPCGLPLAKIGIKHLQLFRDWLALNKASVAKQNYVVRGIRQALLFAETSLFIKSPPTIKQLQHRAVAPKLLFRDDEIEKLWQACERAKWPKLDRDGKKLPCSTPTIWRAMIVLYWTYGFRTQELVRNEKDFRSLQWRDIYQPGLTPNPVGAETCQWGWIRYVPQKQERMKPEPLTNPLTMHARAAIEWLRRDSAKLEDDIFYLPLSSVSFYGQWKWLLEFSGIKPREGSGCDDFLIKHFRKTATTNLSNLIPGAGPAIVGHADDRSGQSMVSNKHYNNEEQMVCKALEALKPPCCFGQLLRCDVKEAG